MTTRSQPRPNGGPRHGAGRNPAINPYKVIRTIRLTEELDAAVKDARGATTWADWIRGLIEREVEL